MRGVPLGDLPIGATVEVPVKPAFQSFLGERIVFKIADQNHAGYPVNSTTLITDKLIALLGFDAKEPANTNAARRDGGNNRYIWSNISQWLNSNGAANAWYSAKHSADAPPTASGFENGISYNDKAGFLAMFDDSFVAALSTTTITIARNTVTDGGGSETLATKVFLASTTEMGTQNENGIAEGVRLAIFTDSESRTAYPTAECVASSNFTSAGFGVTNPWYQRLRTPAHTSTMNGHRLEPNGDWAAGGAKVAFGPYGVRPLCNIPSSASVTAKPNERGNYEFAW